MRVFRRKLDIMKRHEVRTCYSICKIKNYMCYFTKMFITMLLYAVCVGAVPINRNITVASRLFSRKSRVVRGGATNLFPSY